MSDRVRPRKTPSAERLEQERQALDLRRAGVTYDQISRQLGLAGPGVAFRYVKTALGRTLQEPADDLRRIEADRLDRMLRAYWPGVMAGDEKAGRLALGVMDRRAKLLGLDAPVRTQVEVTDTVTAEVERLAALLGMTTDRATEAPDV